MASTLDFYSIAHEPLLVLRLRYLFICDYNQCAALILDKCYTRTEQADRHNSSPDMTTLMGDYVYTTYSKLAQDLFGLFDKETIEDAIVQLVSSTFIRAWYIDSPDGIEEGQLEFLCIPERVDFACEPFYQAISKQNTTRERENQIQVPIELPPFDPTFDGEEHDRLQCEAILTREKQRVKQQLKRAIRAGLPATLTVDQWLATLDHFEWGCAYCNGEYSLMEHFVPITHYGGTTQSNCVPACSSCNNIKYAWHPSRIPDSPKALILKQGLVRVQAYLKTFEGEDA